MKDNEIINLYLQRSQESIVETKKKYGAYSRAIAKNILLDALDIEECLAAPHTVEDEYEEPRNLFIRRYWYTNSIEELARMFDMSPSKVKSMLFRVRNKLRFYLEEQEINL